LEKELNIHVRPLSWPIGMGKEFKGVYNIHDQELRLFSINKTKLADDVVAIESLESPVLSDVVGQKFADKLREDVDFIQEFYEDFDKNLYQEGYLAPVFFGSAINNFGVGELLDTFVKVAPHPQPRDAAQRTVAPEENNFTGFIFKIHANLDPNHRDRIAFCRICSGKFERNKQYLHTRLNKKVRFSSPTSFMANEKSLLEEAWPGDVVGLYDTGIFKIGDTLSEGEILNYKGIPSFSPEIFKEVLNRDPFKAKQLEKGIHQLTDEGVAQLFLQQPGNRKIIGTVGDLQFDVIQFRLLQEYGATCDLRPLNYFKACWMTSDDKEALKRFISLKGSQIAYDKDNNPVFFAETNWILRSAQESYPMINFHLTSEFKTDLQASYR